MNLNVKTSTSSYDILIENNLFEKSGEIIKNIVSNNNVFVITDETVNKIYGKTLADILNKNNVNYKIMVLPAGEKTKSLQHLAKIYSKLAECKISRKDYIVAFGGGVIGDIGGFAAATYLRGVKYIQIPTTLLAQVDSSVGGKVAVDLPEGKNLVGNFYPPIKVLIDPMLLNSLPERTFNDGMAEVIKYGAIRDKELFDDLMNKNIKDILENVIYKCVSIKRDVVMKDEFDTGERMILNFGHTFGHVVESFYNYEKYTHGEGVAIGMCHITKRSEEMGLTKSGTYKDIVKICKKYDLYFGEQNISRDEIEKILFLDKKSDKNSINYIILDEIGKVKIMNFSKEVHII